MTKPLIAIQSLVLALFVGACTKPPAPVEAQVPDFTEEQRQEAVIEAATARFNSTVKEAFLEKGMTVWGLRAALEQQSKHPRQADPKLAKLDPSRFDEHATAASKLELVKGKVVYTALASPRDASAAVLRNERDELRLGYVVAAVVTPDGELREPEVRRVDEVRTSKTQERAQASR